ncbi:hypothetical protein SAMN04515674_104266 [Pseudarcicella hirudinis]|uniref:Uncharacterized protein n=1 Tax=Pseudarcicella hirudinis TaxID=1079859 RepID=A0A1I5RV72_9BACT|nr:hypothetical protein [Pseudarcicella hirudinis]SFP62462.1 hypothetical protein SAMN04515674_104266 [Pseudarcicella hirudinis]
MKVLAVVEINLLGEIVTNRPDEVFFKDCDATRAAAFFEKVEMLEQKHRNLTEIENYRINNLNATFQHVKDWGFVHHSELNKYWEKKMVEFEHRITWKLVLKYRIWSPIKKLFYKTIGKIGTPLIKHILK